MISPKVSIITIYTNDRQIAECEKWIDEQDYIGEVEKIFLNNKGNKIYSSAASALNNGAEKSSGDILFFMHQDVYLWDTSSITKYVEYVINNPNCILGVAGVWLKDKKVHYDIYQGFEKNRYELPANGQIEQVSSLDECLICMTKKRWNELRFDQITCYNWHFYCVDICYNNALNGGKNVLYPLEICHESIGSMDNDAFKNTLKKMVKKYKGKIKRLETTCLRIKCTERACRRYLFVFNLKSKIKKILGVKNG